MSSPPKTEALPVIHQVPELREVLADELIGVAILEGNAVLTFAINRVFEGNDRHDAPTYRSVVCRLALTKTGLRQLAEAIPRLEASIRLADQAPVGSQPN